MHLILNSLAGAVINRARGSRLFDQTTSTELARIVSAIAMGVLVYVNLAADPLVAYLSMIWAVPTLLLWGTFAWDKYWSAAIGNCTNIAAPAFAPVDWIMTKLSLPAVTNAQLRRWGLVAMTLRMSLIVPYFFGLAFISGHPAHAIYAIGFILFGLPYYVAGYAWPKAPIMIAELTVGALIGLLTAMTIT